MKSKIVAVLAFVTFTINLADAQGFSWESTQKEHLERLADSLTVNLKPWNVLHKTFSVDTFGAVADGQTNNTDAIQKAIDVCSASGGGVVLFPQGQYVTGTIELKSGVMLEVAEKAVILGSTKLSDYPERIESFKSIMSELYNFRQSLIYAEKAVNVGIQGKGEIYFRGEREHFPGPQTTGKIEGRPLGIRMIECKNVVVRDIFLHNSAAWMQNYVLCENMIFDGITVVNHANYNNDGLDPDGCRNVIVRNCMINSEDDAMCLKGASGRPTENILIENSTFVTTCNALKIGTDTQGSFRNIVARNLILGGIPDSLITSQGREASTGISIMTVDGGNVENIYISHVTINQSRCPVFLRIGNRGRVLQGVPTPLPGYLKNIIIEDVSGERNYRQGSFISGIAGYPVEDIVIRNYRMITAGGGTVEMANALVAENEAGYPDAHKFSKVGLPAFGFFIRHARNILLENVKTIPNYPDARPEFANGGNIQYVIVNGKDIK